MHGCMNGTSGALDSHGLGAAMGWLRPHPTLKSRAEFDRRMAVLRAAYLVAHHGGSHAADPATFAAFSPRIAALNNGRTKPSPTSSSARSTRPSQAATPPAPFNS